jgi:hypothetical protein
MSQSTDDATCPMCCPESYPGRILVVSWSRRLVCVMVGFVCVIRVIYNRRRQYMAVQWCPRPRVPTSDQLRARQMSALRTKPGEKVCIRVRAIACRWRRTVVQSLPGQSCVSVLRSQVQPWRPE